MGVDAEMFVRHSGRLTPAQVRELSSDLSAAFWREPFMIFRPGEYDYTHGRHALEIVEQINQDGPEINAERGEQFIRVHLAWRYYGKGYERGCWPTYYAISRWLKARIPKCSVWYGGDSSGVLHEEMTDEFEREMWDHFIAHGHAPYIEHDNPYMQKIAKPVCDFCNRAMWNQSSGPYEKRGFKCEGCGWRCSTVDGGKTFQPESKEAAH